MLIGFNFAIIPDRGIKTSFFEKIIFGNPILSRYPSPFKIFYK
jgi:hypothetical protein